MGNKSLLIDKKTESYLFKHGFFDENILALKIDSGEEYTVFVNENIYDGELSSTERVFEFLKYKYLDPSILLTIENTTVQVINLFQNMVEPIGVFKTDKGDINVKLNFKGANPALNNKAFKNDALAKDGKYKLGFMDYIIIRDGIIVDFTSF